MNSHQRQLKRIQTSNLGDSRYFEESLRLNETESRDDNRKIIDVQGIILSGEGIDLRQYCLNIRDEKQK